MERPNPVRHYAHMEKGPSKPPHHIRAWRKKRGMTQEDLAAAIGVSTASISQLETGKQGFMSSTLYALAEALNVPPGDLLSRGPVSEADISTVVDVVGYLGAGAEVEREFEQLTDGLDQIEVPFKLPDEMIAFRVRGDSMLPKFDPDDVLIVYKDQKKPLDSFYGHTAAVETADGRRFVKSIMRGSSQTVVNLISWNAAPIEDVRLEWIGEIFAVLPPAAVRKIPRQGGVQGQLKLRNE